ncbi:hypothetical protein TNCV_3024441 [Trichonephila clavipes]|nr:hypothetical protein TNCV_3024441 [Trichonephila clavipes]
MPQKLVLGATFSEPPQRSTPSTYSSFQQMSEANCIQWVYIVHSSISFEAQSPALAQCDSLERRCPLHHLIEVQNYEILARYLNWHPHSKLPHPTNGRTESRQMLLALALLHSEASVA